MPRTGKCSGCCVRDLDCEACARCLPRYLCVNVIVTPGDYTDLTCCAIDDYDGTGRFGFRMTNQCGTWTGSGSCDGLGSSFDLTVQVLRVNGECVTRISSTLFASFDLPGTLPAGMTGSAVSDAGDVFDWEIVPADVVENPLIRERCSPCSCATCLPRRICVTVDRAENDYDPAAQETASGIWDCETSSWTLPPDIAGVSVQVALKPITDHICGLDVTASGAGLQGLADEIRLEDGLHGRKIHGTLCEDSEELISTLGVPELLPCETEPCEDPPPQRWVSAIDATFSLFAADGTTILGTLRIQDQSCGECEACGVQTCCLNRWPTTLYAEYYTFTPGTAASVTALPAPAIVPLYWMDGPFSGGFRGYYGRLEGVPTYTTQPGNPVPQLDDFATTVEFSLACDAGDGELSRVLWSRWQRSDLPERAATDPPGPLTAYFLVEDQHGIVTSANCRPLPDPLPTNQGLACCDPPLHWVPTPTLQYGWVAISA